MALKEHLYINEVRMERILSDIENDPFIEAHESLSSHYKVNSYLDENFKMVRPIEIVLNFQDVKCGHPKEVIHMFR